MIVITLSVVGTTFVLLKLAGAIRWTWGKVLIPYLLLLAIMLLNFTLALLGLEPIQL